MTLVISLTGLLGSPWTRSQPVAARVVAERGQNAPVDSLESLWTSFCDHELLMRA